LRKMNCRLPPTCPGSKTLPASRRNRRRDYTASRHEWRRASEFYVAGGTRMFFVDT
jgi:hypothetical protein